MPLKLIVTPIIIHNSVQTNCGILEIDIKAVIVKNLKMFSKHVFL